MAPSARADEATDAARAADVRAGLCLHLGATDGQLEAALAGDGRVLVQGIATDREALRRSREAVVAKGLYGLASVTEGSLDPLPYARDLANLVVADEAALAGRHFSEAEVMRVLAPGGVACLKKDGRWVRVVKPRPKEADDWTHFDHGPDGNGLSHDHLVRPPTFLQWIDDIQFISPEGNPAAYRPFTSFRCEGGRAYFEWSTGIERGSREKDKQLYYTGRDAFNGLPLWDVTNATQQDRKEMQFVAGGGKLYAFLEKGGPLVALDGATGKALRTYDKGGRLTEDLRRTTVRVVDGTVVESSADTVYALDERSGDVKWAYKAPGADVLFPVVDREGARVFVALADPPTRGSSRWPVAKAQAVVCLGLSDGGERWHNDAVKGSYLGQLVYRDGDLALFASGAIGGGEGDQTFVGDIDPADGRLRWRTSFKHSWNSAGYNMLLRDHSVYFADAWRIRALDLAGGAETTAFDDGGYNQRCNRFSATDDYFMFGLVTYVRKDATADVSSITRSGCAQGAIPANGLLYFTPNACHCINQVRGFLALSPEPVAEPVPDERRLDPDPPAALAGPVGATPAAAASGPIANDWAHEQKFDGAETAPVEADGLRYVSVIHADRLECRDRDGKALWRYVAGGRIGSPPVVSGGRCFFGSHDGYVYCLNAKDGKPLWRFLAAPYDRRVMVYGQPAGSWPVLGVVMNDGAVCATAGLHPETGGGIWCWGLEPASGKVVWKKVLRRGAVEVHSNPGKTIHPNTVINDVPRSENGRIVLPGLSFDPRQSDAEITQELAGKDDPPKKKKK